MDSLESLESDLIAARADEHNATLQLELDKNKSEKLITALYRERSKMRAEIEELETVTENFKNDIELMDPLYKKIVDEKSAVDDELKEVLNQIKESEAPLRSLEDANKPIFENYKSLVEDQKKLEEKLGELKKSADSLSGDLGALSRERNTAQSNFDSKRTEVLLEVKHPGHLYFGDQMEVMVSSKAPSGKGLFIDKGEEAGIREGMTFMGCKSLEIQKVPMLFNASVVERKFAFLEFIQSGNSSENLSVVDGEKLFLIRSGDLNTTK